MMKRTALVLCLAAAAACGGKSDSNESKPASESSESTSSSSSTSGNRSSKVELPPKRSPTVDTSPEEASDARRQRGPRDPARWEARQKERMAEIDTDGDGKVSDEERTAARKLRMEERMTRLDSDGDGKLSKEEVAASRFRRIDFDTADTNKDGFLSIEELDAAAMRSNMGPGRRGFNRGGERVPRDGSAAPAPADPARP